MNINNAAFWDDFNKQSDNLSTPFYYPKLVENAGEVAALLHRCFENIPRFPDQLPQIRVFDEKGGIRMDLCEKLIQNAGEPIASLSPWIQQVLGISQFCIAFKNITRYHAPLEQLFHATLVKPYIRQFGIPAGGFEFYTFIGNYGFTPFGIHDDPEHSLLINLGPGVKQVWVWSPSNYVQHNKSPFPRIQFDQSFLHTADYYVELKEGDFYHIPQGMYHVLHSDDYSCMVGIIPYPASLSGMLKTTCQAWDSTVDKVDMDTPCKVEDYISQQASREPAQVIACYAQLLESNGYLAFPPHRITCGYSNNHTIKATFPLFYRHTQKDVLEIMGRMRVFSFPYAASVTDLVNALNEGKELTIASLRRKLKKELEEDLVAYLLDILVHHQVAVIAK